MRREFGLCLSLAAAGMMAGACTQAPQSPPVDLVAVEQEIRQLDLALPGMIAARDSSTIVTMYADEARVLPGNAPLAVGREAIAALWGEFLRMPGLQVAAEPQKVEISSSGDLAVSTGNYRMTFETPGGVVTDTGKWMTVYRKSGAEWKIVLDTWNSDLSPFPPAPARKK